MPEKFTFFKSYWDTARRLENDADRLAWYDALTAYVFEGIDPKLPIVLDLAWLNVRPVIDKGLEAAANGAKGGRPRKSEQVGTSGGKGGGKQAKTPREDVETPLKTLSISNSKSKRKSIRTSTAQANGGKAPSFHACPECGARVSKLFDRQGQPWVCPECGTLETEPETKEARA